MKLLRYGERGKEIPAMLDEAGHIRDLSAYVHDFYGEAVSTKTLKRLQSLDTDSLPTLPKGQRIGACLRDIPTFFAIGLNYHDHVKETGSRTPPEPLLFSKATTCINGPYDPIILPKDAGKSSVHTDWEVELGMVIGQDCYQVSEEAALDYVSAYFAANDVSEREFQKNRGGQMIKGKSAPSFGPIGPYLVTPDEIGDPQNLKLQTLVNGEIQQDSNTREMIFSCAMIIHKISGYMALRTGDVIITGTPAGVGLGQTPPRFLGAGDVVEISVEGLGAQRAEVIAG